MVKPPVVAVVNGKVSYLSCNPEDSTHQLIAIDVAERLAKTLFNYSRREKKSFAEQYNRFKRFIYPHSKAEGKINGLARRVLGSENATGPIESETSAVEIDAESAQAMIDPKNPTILYLLIKAKQSIRRDSGNVYRSFNFRITFTQGGTREIFQVADFGIDELPSGNVG